MSTRDLASRAHCVVAASLCGTGDPAFEFVRWTGGTMESLVWSRQELAEAVGAQAARLGAHTRPRDRVIVAHPPGPAFVAAFLGCLASGRIAVPAPAPRGAASRAAVARLAAAADAALILSDGMAGPPVYAPTEPAAFAPAAPEPDDVAYLQFTSGSTRAPRGAVITHRALRANIAAIGDAWRLTPEDRGVFWLPPFHDMGLVGALLAPIAWGVPSTLMHPGAFLQRPARWLELMSARRGTFSGGPDFAYEIAAARVDDAAPYDLSSWRVAVNGAEPVRRAAMQRFAEKFAPSGFRAEAFAPGYGLAEAVLFVSARRPDDPCALDGDGPADCGAPGSGIDVRIVDEASGAVQPDGAEGAIWVSGDTLAAGYWNDDEATRDAFGGRIAGDPRRWLRTGDVGALRQGRLFVTGRAKDVLIRGGRKLHAADIEAEARRALGRRVSVAAFADADSRHGERIVLVVEHAADDPAAVFAVLCEALGAHLDVAPDEIALCAPGAVRVTTSGKTARAATRDAWRAGLLPVRAVWRRPVSAAA
jgi:acyl-CoA synthetase (AMP-forming)/AMP-acid ligase II